MMAAGSPRSACGVLATATALGPLMSRNAAGLKPWLSCTACGLRFTRHVQPRSAEDRPPGEADLQRFGPIRPLHPAASAFPSTGTMLQGGRALRPGGRQSPPSRMDERSGSLARGCPGDQPRGITTLSLSATTPMSSVCPRAPPHYSNLPTSSRTRIRCVRLSTRTRFDVN